jgi:uridine kinase
MDEVLTRYQNTLKPMHQQFIEPTKAFADIIIPNDRYNTVAIDVEGSNKSKNSIILL